jgi:hypothetical protein
VTSKLVAQEGEVVSRFFLFLFPEKVAGQNDPLTAYCSCLLGCDCSDLLPDRNLFSYTAPVFFPNSLMSSNFLGVTLPLSPSSFSRASMSRSRDQEKFESHPLCTGPKMDTSHWTAETEQVGVTNRVSSSLMINLQHLTFQGCTSTCPVYLLSLNSSDDLEL